MAAIATPATMRRSSGASQVQADDDTGAQRGGPEGVRGRPGVSAQIDEGERAGGARPLHDVLERGRDVRGHFERHHAGEHGPPRAQHEGEHQHHDRDGAENAPVTPGVHHVLGEPREPRRPVLHDETHDRAIRGPAPPVCTSKYVDTHACMAAAWVRGGRASRHRSPPEGEQPRAVRGSRTYRSRRRCRWRCPRRRAGRGHLRHRRRDHRRRVRRGAAGLRPPRPRPRVARPGAPGAGRGRRGRGRPRRVRRPLPRPRALRHLRAGQCDMCSNGRYTEHGIKGLDGFVRERYWAAADRLVRRRLPARARRRPPGADDASSPRRGRRSTGSPTAPRRSRRSRSSPAPARSGCSRRSSASSAAWRCTSSTR